MKERQRAKLELMARAGNAAQGIGQKDEKT